MRNSIKSGSRDKSDIIYYVCTIRWGAAFLRRDTFMLSTVGTHLCCPQDIDSRGMCDSSFFYRDIIPAEYFNVLDCSRARKDGVVVQTQYIVSAG